MASSAAFGSIAQLQGVATASMNPRHAEDDSSSSATINDDVAAEQQGAEVTKLARALTHNSTKTTRSNISTDKNPFVDQSDPTLNPHSEKFDNRKWVKSLIGITSRDPERYPRRTAGVSFRDLAAYGFGNPTDYQKTFGNYPLELLGLFNKLRGRGGRKIQILRDFDGLVKSGEMLIVLGRPGSGCTTLLKTISGSTNGFWVEDKSVINYQGISPKTMHHDFRGECIYQAEVDVHFPQLTVGQTLGFAAQARAPSNRLPGITRQQYAEHLRDVVMAVFGLTHTMNTKVGNDFIRGVSGGERKRVSIAEAALGGAPLQCWDNSTRGLDSATALEFVNTLRLSTEIAGSTAIVAIYQASQNIYDRFDKVTVLYEGRQIYFGDIVAAKEFFINMGFECPERQTTADFLTSLTSPFERRVRPGFENSTPKTPDEFAARWKESPDRKKLLEEIAQFEADYPLDGPRLQEFANAHRAQQAKHQRPTSPYTLSVPMQVKLCMQRGFQRLKGDLTLTISGIIGNTIMALVVGSVFFRLNNDSTTLTSRGSLIFFAILLNAFSSALEIPTLFAQRPIVEKHTKYAFYHPFSEAIATMVCDLPNKIGTSIFFNLALYLMTGLRQTAQHFFIFLLFSFVTVMTMSMFFRSIGSTSRTLSQAMAPSSLFILGLVIYTGFTIPIRDMKPWFRWINYLNPVAYAFEALMINEFSGRQIPCIQFVPSGPEYDNVSSLEKICAATGSEAGTAFVDGDTYLRVNYLYAPDHLWRNLGVLFAFMFLGCAIHLCTTEFIQEKKSKGEVLLFRRGALPEADSKTDEESSTDVRVNSEVMTSARKVATQPELSTAIQRQTAIFHWEEVNYDIKIKNEPRKLLDGVDGWVKPGTLTALMGVSGAGKTTLLDVLASRVTMGVVTGSMLVDGRQRDAGFQRKTGYVQQQDLHLATSTVREALNFSAMLRQPRTTPESEKLAYVDEVIKILEMEQYADAVVGVPGEGLNVEQRKRLTIGVELAAKPELLLFLDEPTSGLDSQTAWSICSLLRKLANNGQAILCTIHQPSAILFQEFDRLLFLAKGGKTVYFGEIGAQSKIMSEYFERGGARTCDPEENPAEWMLDVVKTVPEKAESWHDIWLQSPERQAVKEELAEMRHTLIQKPVSTDPAALLQFAAPFSVQLRAVLVRVFQQYWRTPSYLYSKTILCTLSSLFVGFSFYNSPTSKQGIQNQFFSLFLLLTIFGSLVQQIMPHFVTQRSLYEVRERPSKTYGWKVFMISNIIVELPWNTLMAVIIYVCFYYPIGMFRNALEANQFTERSGLMFLFVFAFLMFTSTFTNMIIAAFESAEAGGNLANMMFSLCLIFCGVLVSPDAMPGFWIFMYRVSPFTYLVDGMLATGIANVAIVCSDIELLTIQPPSGQTCGTYLATYMLQAGGYLVDEAATADCQYCTIKDTNTLLAGLASHYSLRWRNFGLMWVYIIFNASMAMILYWWTRVPKGAKKEDDEKKKK